MLTQSEDRYIKKAEAQASARGLFPYNKRNLKFTLQTVIHNTLSVDQSGQATGTAPPGLPFMLDGNQVSLLLTGIAHETILGDIGPFLLS